MKIKIFTNRAFVGEFQKEDIVMNDESIFVGKVISINDKKYVIQTVSLNKDDSLKLEVN